VVTGGLVSVSANEWERRSVEQGPELPRGGRSGRSTSKKVVLALARCRAGCAASTVAMSWTERRRWRGVATEEWKWESRVKQRKRRRGAEEVGIVRARLCPTQD
jgi:hypothetical protein